MNFPEWAATEVVRILRARERAESHEERAQYELQLALLCNAADRYGRSLTEASEL